MPRLRRLDRFLTAKLISAGMLIAATPAAAVDIPVSNAGFEADPVAMGCFAVFTPNAWNVFDPGGISGGGDVVGGLHPEGGPYFAMAPEGDHVAIVFLQGDIGGAPMGLSQTLSETLLPDQRYTLSVQIGDIASGTGPPPCDIFGFFDLDGFPGYQVQLLAGGVVIAEDDNSLAPLLSDGVFMETTLEAVIDDAHPQLGQSLEIRLINLNMIDTPEHPGIEVDFDDVRLSRECRFNGDIDDNGTIDAVDAGIFVNVLLGADTDGAHVERSDVNCSGTVDGRDVAEMVAHLLSV